MYGGEIMVFEKIKEILVDQLSIDESEITMGSAFIDDLGADSLDIVDLIMTIEEEFDIEIPEDEVESIATVGAAVDYIKANANM
jgi:acyl carrier protein